jgi:hypothetical protein
LYVIHTMAPRPTVIGSRVIGVDLPAFLLSKNVYSESIGMPRSAASAALESRPGYDRPFKLDRVAVTPNELARDLSGGTYPFALRELAFQLYVSPACAEILLGVLAALRLASEIPRGISCHSFTLSGVEGSLATNHCRKIKNPASSAGYSHPHLGGSTRSSTSF